MDWTEGERHSFFVLTVHSVSSRVLLSASWCSFWPHSIYCGTKVHLVSHLSQELAHYEALWSGCLRAEMAGVVFVHSFIWKARPSWVSLNTRTQCGIHSKMEYLPPIAWHLASQPDIDNEMWMTALDYFILDPGKSQVKKLDSEDDFTSF